MNIKFNLGQLSRPQRESLEKVLAVVQSENEGEVVVQPVEFPNKLLVEIDGGVELMLGWDLEKSSYEGLTIPKTEPEPAPKPESQKDTVDIPTPESKPIDLSPVLVRVDALAVALINLAKPFDNNVRTELWSAFCKKLFKEFLE